MQFLKVTELQMEKSGSELDSLAPESVLLTTMCAQHTVLGDYNFQEGIHKLSSEREDSQETDSQLNSIGSSNTRQY